MLQHTLKKPVCFEGRGLHLGQPVRLAVTPAAPGTGIVFCRSDLGDVCIPAKWDRVECARLNTRIFAPSGAYVSTIEHLMAALAGVGIHNARCILDGPEVPILDGSSAPFVRGLMAAGSVEQNAPLRVIEILEPVSVAQGDASARLSPCDGVRMSFHIDFPDEVIGVQDLSLDMANGAFLRELCDSRTFCRQSDVAMMQSQGLALGGTPENAVVVEGNQVVSPGGLRHADEAVRHKMLDALGDLYTIGAPIIGHYEGSRAGHAVTNGLIRALMDRPKAWRYVNVSAQMAYKLPGAQISAQDMAAVA